MPFELTAAPFVRRVIAARRARGRFFNAELFADPAWDILLELYALHCDQRPTRVSKVCAAAAVPVTTALRWVDELESEDLLIREPNLLDTRRVWVSISHPGLVATLSKRPHTRVSTALS